MSDAAVKPQEVNKSRDTTNDVVGRHLLTSACPDATTPSTRRASSSHQDSGFLTMTDPYADAKVSSMTRQGAACDVLATGAVDGAAPSVAPKDGAAPSVPPRDGLPTVTPQPAADVVAPAVAPAQPAADSSWLSRTGHWLSGAADVTGEVVAGAAGSVYTAVTEHPGQTLLHVAEGAAIGVAVVAAAPIAGALGAGAAVVGGIALAGDAAIVGLTAAGVIGAASDVSAAATNASQAASVLMNPESHTPAELEAARKNIRDTTGDAALEATVALAGVGAGAFSGVRAVSALKGLVKGTGRVAADTINPVLNPGGDIPPPPVAPTSPVASTEAPPPPVAPRGPGTDAPGPAPQTDANTQAPKVTADAPTPVPTTDAPAPLTPQGAAAADQIAHAQDIPSLKKAIADAGANADDPAVAAAVKQALIKQIDDPNVPFKQISDLIGDTTGTKFDFVRVEKPDADVVSALRTRAMSEIEHNPNVFTGDSAATRQAIQDIRNGADPKIAGKDITNAIDPSLTPEEKAAVLIKMAEGNKPIIDAFLKQTDAEFGTESKSNIKKFETILEKTARADTLRKYPWMDVEHVRDTLRFKTPLDSVADLPKLVQNLQDAGFHIVKADTDMMLNPKMTGWRAANFDIMLPNGQIAEYAMPIKELNAIDTHGDYEFIRSADPRSLSPAGIAEYHTRMGRVQAEFAAAWKAHLEHTGLSEEDVKGILDHVQMSIQ